MYVFNALNSIWRNKKKYVFSQSDTYGGVAARGQYH